MSRHCHRQDPRTTNAKCGLGNGLVQAPRCQDWLSPQRCRRWRDGRACALSATSAPRDPAHADERRRRGVRVRGGSPQPDDGVRGVSQADAGASGSPSGERQARLGQNPRRSCQHQATASRCEMASLMGCLQTGCQSSFRAPVGRGSWPLFHRQAARSFDAASPSRRWPTQTSCLPPPERHFLAHPRRVRHPISRPTSPHVHPWARCTAAVESQ
mmetsp:Transcript_49206/g.130297  ORF Transcript_49206/g.130297 Transcript_49206/m.130297 type:complete len:214 (-) Transcript_49206:1787-2428(-)